MFDSNNYNSFNIKIINLYNYLSSLAPSGTPGPHQRQQQRVRRDRVPRRDRAGAEARGACTQGHPCGSSLWQPLNS